MRVAALTAAVLLTTTPITAWGQVAVQPLGETPLSHLRLGPGWTADPNSSTSRFSATPDAAHDPRTQWELGAQVSQKSASNNMDERANQGRGRWLLFVAASGRAAGLNMSPAGVGGGSTWSSGSASNMINDGQAGIGWRKAGMQASIGYVHREINGRAFDPYAAHTRNLSDSMVGLSFSLHSR